MLRLNSSPGPTQPLCPFIGASQSPQASQSVGRLLGQGFLGAGKGWTNKLPFQFSSVAQSCPTLCDPMDCSTPGLPVHHQLLESTKPMSAESVMPCNHLILCRPLLLLPSIFPSLRVFSNESALRIRWPKFWSFSITPSNEYSGPVSFRMDWLDLLEVQRPLKSLL